MSKEKSTEKKCISIIQSQNLLRWRVALNFTENVVGMKVATRGFCSKSLWAYILKKNLFVQNIGNGKKFFVPDAYLSTGLGTRQI